MNKLLKTKIFTPLAAIGAVLGFLWTGCTNDVSDGLGQREHVWVQMSVGTRTVSETNGTPTADEARLHSIRVYAFAGGQLLGHYYDGELTESTDPVSFFMDVNLLEGTQSVNFYAIANEHAVSTGGEPGKALTEQTTEAQLNAFTFTQLNRVDNSIATHGLPMVNKQTVQLNFNEDADNTPNTTPGHEGHTILKQILEFKLERPMGKLGVFAAKTGDETAELKITGLKMLSSGRPMANYLMPQTDETLKRISTGKGEKQLEVIPGSVTASLAENATEETRKNPANYTAVLNETYYPFETPWGSKLWNQPGDEKGNVLEIKYQFNGGEEQTGLVYMPSIVRNHYYTVLCLISNNGKITVEYWVADWDDMSQWDNGLTFEYPTYENPIKPADQKDPEEGKLYPQPTVYCPANTESTDGSYTFSFSLTAPAEQTWKPTLLNATAADYEVTVLQNGEVVTNPKASSDPFQIRVKALQQDKVNFEVHLGIAFAPIWDITGQSLLLINGENNKYRWTGSNDEQVIVIKQTDRPIVTTE